MLAAIARLYRADPASATTAGIVGLTGLPRGPVLRACTALLAAGRIERMHGGTSRRATTYRVIKKTGTT